MFIPCAAVFFHIIPPLLWLSSSASCSLNLPVQCYCRKSTSLRPCYVPERQIGLSQFFFDADHVTHSADINLAITFIDIIATIKLLPGRYLAATTLVSPPFFR